MEPTNYSTHHHEHYPALSTSDPIDYALNLSVLQRHLPSTVALAFVAPYAVVYICNPTTFAWEKSGIEGTLFVVQLSTERHAVVVLNRLGLDNFILNLKSAEEVEVTPEYVILAGNEGDNLGGGDTEKRTVYGLWIFEEEQGSTKGVRERCGQYIADCAELAGQLDARDNGREQQYNLTARPTGPDLMALLNPSRGYRAR